MEAVSHGLEKDHAVQLQQALHRQSIELVEQVEHRAAKDKESHETAVIEETVAIVSRELSRQHAVQLQLQSDRLEYELNNQKEALCQEFESVRQHLEDEHATSLQHIHDKHATEIQLLQQQQQKLQRKATSSPEATKSSPSMDCSYYVTTAPKSRFETAVAREIAKVHESAVHGQTSLEDWMSASSRPRRALKNKTKTTTTTTTPTMRHLN